LHDLSHGLIHKVGGLVQLLAIPAERLLAAVTRVAERTGPIPLLVLAHESPAGLVRLDLIGV
jgi:hypothetical protein